MFTTLLVALFTPTRGKSCARAEGKHRFRPSVLELENRITPSALPKGFIGPIQLGEQIGQDGAPVLTATPLSHQSTSPVKKASPFAKSQPAIPSAVIDFAQLPNNASYTLYVKLVAKDGTTFSQSYNIQAGTTPTAVRDLVYNSIPQYNSASNGWYISKSGTTALTITAYVYYSTGTQSPISSVGSAGKGLQNNQQPAVSTTSGVKRGQMTSGGNFKFSFLQSPIDGTSTLQDNATIQATIDGVVVQTTSESGETYSQVANDLYNAMVTAGMSDVTISGGDISFLDDTNGQETLGASLTFTGSGGQAVSWIEVDETVAARTILS